MKKPAHRFLASTLFVVALACLPLLSAVASSAATEHQGGANRQPGISKAATGQWTVVPPVTSRELRDVYMVSSNLGWAVGGASGIEGTVLRYDGTAWQQVDI